MLDDVGYPAAMFEMETQRQALDQSRIKQKTKTDSWLQRIGGNPAANHLIAEGWLPFLTALDAPDIDLWHQIISDFHELYGDRLDAAYWILEQPECDRATAWTFLMGMMSWDVLMQVVHTDLRQKTRVNRDRFEAVVDKWDNGFYTRHALQADPDAANGHYGLDFKVIREVYDQFATEYEIAPLRLPKDMEFDVSKSTDDKSRSVDLGLDFSDEEGLMLRFGKDWHKPAWHPKA